MRSVSRFAARCRGGRTRRGRGRAAWWGSGPGRPVSPRRARRRRLRRRGRRSVIGAGLAGGGVERFEVGPPLPGDLVDQGRPPLDPGGPARARGAGRVLVAGERRRRRRSRSRRSGSSAALSARRQVDDEQVGREVRRGRVGERPPEGDHACRRGGATGPRSTRRWWRPARPAPPRRRRRRGPSGRPGGRGRRRGSRRSRSACRRAPRWGRRLRTGRRSAASGARGGRRSRAAGRRRSRPARGAWGRGSRRCRRGTRSG